MKLLAYLKELPRRRLNQIADQHQVFYEPNFSNLWVADKIKNKLLNNNYLQKIIKQQLNPQANRILNQLIVNHSINKSNLPQSAIKQLQQLGLIYEKNNSYQLPEDIKKILADNLNLSPTKQSNQVKTQQSTTEKNKNNTAKKEKITIKQKAPLSFYDYLLLSLSYLQQTSSGELNNYLQQINCSSLSSRQLTDKILTYAQEFNLLAKDQIVTSQVDKWITTSFKKILLQSLAVFFPQRESVLRKITAVLIHYPASEQLPINSLQSEIGELSLTNQSQELLQLLNLFEFTDQNLSLTSFCWQTFNSQLEAALNSPETKESQTIIKLPTSRRQLWEICQSQQLVEINQQLIFTAQNKTDSVGD